MRKSFLLLFIACTLPLVAQQYPRWFLFPGEIHCTTTVTVITQPPTYYRDSAIAHAFRLGCDMLARYTAMHVAGGQTFWATEAGIHSMGAKYEVLYDTALTDFYRSTRIVLDAFVDKQRTLVLVGDSNCAVDDNARSMVRLDKISQPQWVEQPPADNRYHYAVGFSEEFYYETSSWQTAEKNAYMALARS